MMKSNCIICDRRGVQTTTIVGPLHLTPKRNMRPKDAQRWCINCHMRNAKILQKEQRSKAVVEGGVGTTNNCGEHAEQDDHNMFDVATEIGGEDVGADDDVMCVGNSEVEVVAVEVYDLMDELTADLGLDMGKLLFILFSYLWM